MERKLLMYIFGNIDVINEYNNKKLFEYQKMYKQNLVGTNFVELSKNIKHIMVPNRLEFYDNISKYSLLESNNMLKYLYYYDSLSCLYREKNQNDKINPFKIFIKENPIFETYIDNKINTDTNMFYSRFCTIYDEYIELLKKINICITEGCFEDCIKITHNINKCKLLMFSLMKLNNKQIKLYSSNNRYRCEINNTLDLIKYVIERNLI